MHNDGMSMPILRLAREPGDKRTGTFTSGIVLNAGCTEMLVDLLERRLEQVVEEAGGPSLRRLRRSLPRSTWWPA